MEKGNRRILLGAFGVVAVAILGTGAYFVSQGQIGPYDLPKESRKLDTTLAKSKALGLPMTKADMMPATAIPDSENSALVVIPAIINLPSPVVSGQAFLPGGDPEKRATMLKTLATHRPVLNEVRAGLKRPNWYIERDWDLGPNLAFPEYAKMKSAVKLMAAESVLLATQGKPAEALATLTAGRKLTKYASNDATLIGMLVAIACDAIMLRAAEELTQVWGKDNAALDRLASTIEATNFTIDPRPAWRGEFYMALSYTRNFEMYGGIKGLESMSGAEGAEQFQPPSPDKLKRDGTPDSMTARAMLNPIAETWNKVFEKWASTPPPPGEWGPYLDKLSNAAGESESASHKLAQLLFPVFAQADQALIKQQLTPKMNVALIRAVQFRNQTGRFPSSLKEIKMDFKDGFGSDQIQYSSNSGIVQIWSIGQDKVNNGGPLIRKMPTEGKRDIGVVYPSTTRRKLTAPSSA